MIYFSVKNSEMVKVGSDDYVSVIQLFGRSPEHAYDVPSDESVFQPEAMCP